MRLFTDSIGAAQGVATFMFLVLTSVGAYAQQAPDSFDIELVDSEIGFEYLQGYTDPSDGNRDYDPDVLYRVEYGVDVNGDSLAAEVPKTAEFTLNGEDFLPLIRTRRDREGEPFDQVIPVRFVDAPDQSDALQLCASDNLSGTTCNDVKNINKNSFYHAYDGSTPLVDETDDSNEACPIGGCPVARFRSEQVTCFKCIPNSFKIDRGTDNLFSNANQARTRNNIGRMDLLLDDPIVISTAQGEAFDSTNPGAILSNVGFLAMERGGNDNISLTAVKGIRGLDSIAASTEDLDEAEFSHLSPNQRRDLPKLARTIRTYDSSEFEPELIAEGRAATRIVTEVGKLLQTQEESFSGTSCSGSFWGDTEENFRTSVFMNANPAKGKDGHFIENRPDQNLGAQNVCGTFVSLADLGIGLDEEFFGVAIFAGDVSEEMDLITLTDIPRDTSGASGDVGGLDLMGGGGFFFREDIPAFSLTITKTQTSGPNPAMTAGDELGYTIVVENTGAVSQTGVTTSDVLPDGSNGTLSGPTESITADGVLEVGESWTYTIGYTVSQADIDDGEALLNTARVVTDQVPGPTEDTATTPVQQNAALTITKDQTSGPNPAMTAGDELGYTIVVENTGAVSQTGVTTSDVLPDGSNGTLSGPTESITADGVLEVGESWTYTIGYTVSQADIDDGEALLNTARVVTDQVPGPTEDTATTPVQQNAALTITKDQTSGPNPAMTAGDELGYTIVVENTGAVSQTGVTTSDVLPDGSNGT